MLSQYSYSFYINTLWLTYWTVLSKGSDSIVLKMFFWQNVFIEWFNATFAFIALSGIAVFMLASLFDIVLSASIH